MPELPEVETIRRDLESELIGLKLTGVDFIWPGSLKGTTPENFKKAVIRKEIIAVERRAKNLAIKLTGNLYLLMHMKMTGHLLIEPGNKKVSVAGSWQTKEGSLADPINQYIRVVFWLSNGKIMAFSDLRKFGYIRLVTQEELAKVYSDYGPEPFSEAFTPEYLQTIFAGKKQAAKKVLMDQTKIAGIGNIYADEILWAAKIHPETPANSLTMAQIASIHKFTLEILKKAIELRGTSSSDYRDTKGEKGRFEAELNVYRRTNLFCKRCSTPIKRITVGGRGTHFCPKCQRLEQK